LSGVDLVFVSFVVLRAQMVCRRQGRDNTVAYSSGPIADLHRSRTTRWLSGSLVAVALLLTGCGSSRPSGANGSTAARSAINAYEAANGPAAGSWKITLQTSSVDPSYVLFNIGRAPGHDIQDGYGFAHETSGTWAVVGFGSAEVGCPPGASGNAVIPKAVLSGFRLSCPTSG
jgi:hypothetical protein